MRSRLETLRRAQAGTAYIVHNPGAFALAVLKGFRANQGVLLAGAVAYYTLLSIVPLLIIVLIVLAHFVDEALLLDTLRDYLEFIVPGQSAQLVSELRTFLAHRETIGGVLLATMVFFSALAFTVLENAMSVIFFHRVSIRRRHFLMSASMPYLFILFLGVGLLVVAVVSGRLELLASRNVTLSGFSAALLYLMGVTGEILILTAIYLVMPVGRLSLGHALAGGIAAGLLWELTRHVLVWYFGTISQIQVVYGSLTTAITVLLSVEMAALVLLFGAQVIAEYERVQRDTIVKPPKPLHT